MRKRAAGFFLFLMILIFWMQEPALALSQNDSQTVGTSQEMPDVDSIIENRLETGNVDAIKKAIDDMLEDENSELNKTFSADQILSNALKGNPLDNFKGLPKVLTALVGKELKANVALMLQLFAIMLLGALVKNLQPLEKGIPNETARICINGVMMMLAATSFGNAVQIASGTIGAMQEIAGVAMPALFALMASSGKLVSVTALQPIMLLGVNTACHILKNILMPLTVASGILFLVNALSDRFKLGNLAKLLKSTAVWATGVVALVFSIAFSIQKMASGTVDAVTLKTAKFAIGTFIPVAGKYMSDAAETLLLCTSAAGSAVGILTVAGLILSVAVPFIRLFLVMLTFKLAAALGAPLCDEAVCDALEDASSCFSVMLGIVGASFFVLTLLTGTLMSSSGYMR